MLRTRALFAGWVVVLLVSPMVQRSSFASDLFVVSVGVEPSLSANGQRDLYGWDAGYIRRALVSAEPLYDTVHSRVLQGKDAHLQNVTDALEWLQKQVKPADTAVVFFSAHGDLDKKRGFYIHLAQSPGQATQLWGTELRSALNKLPGKVAVLLDTCHSGAALPPESERVGKTNDQVHWLSACKSTELSFGQSKDRKQPHGHFVVAVCEGLRGAADSDHNGIVTFSELADFVPACASRLDRRQRAVSYKPKGQSIELAVVDRAFAPVKRTHKTVPHDPANTRNPFGYVDIINPFGSESVNFAEQVKLAGADDDANAEQWSTFRSAETDISGPWNGRWNYETSPQEWKAGRARVQIIKDRVFIGYYDDSGTYLIEAKRTGDRLIGSYQSVKPLGRSTPWVGRIVSPTRIDGSWISGRWDLRRKPVRKK